MVRFGHIFTIFGFFQYPRFWKTPNIVKYDPRVTILNWSDYWFFARNAIIRSRYLHKKKFIKKYWKSKKLWTSTLHSIFFRESWQIEGFGVWHEPNQWAAQPSTQLACKVGSGLRPLGVKTHWLISRARLTVGAVVRYRPTYRDT